MRVMRTSTRAGSQAEVVTSEPPTAKMGPIDMNFSERLVSLENSLLNRLQTLEV
jgi:hypothetical protein